MASALITGGTSGIGHAFAVEFASRGTDLVLVARDADRLEKVAAELRETHGVEVETISADLAVRDDVMRVADRIEDPARPIDWLINNAGIQHVSPVETFPVDKWNAIIAINLSSVFHTTRLALPGMRARNWGRIINIASVHGLVASKEKSAYVAAKHGVVGLTKTIALETAQTEITCNALCPGWVLTPLVQQQIDKRIAEGAEPEAARDALLAEKQPSREFVTPEQLGNLALFLCSDGAAQVRGVAWNMDGGWVAQ